MVYEKPGSLIVAKNYAKHREPRGGQYYDIQNDKHEVH